MIAQQAGEACMFEAVVVSCSLDACFAVSLFRAGVDVESIHCTNGFGMDVLIISFHLVLSLVVRSHIHPARCM